MPKSFIAVHQWLNTVLLRIQEAACSMIEYLSSEKGFKPPLDVSRFSAIANGCAGANTCVHTRYVHERFGPCSTLRSAAYM